MVKIHAPASIGNVSVGFDVLGAAVSPVDGTLLGDCVTVEVPTNSVCTIKAVLSASCRQTRKTILSISAGTVSAKRLASACR